ncbi:MAG: hypothetical protein M3R10_00430, partial [Verrucomicrobiota bacterium]|nr:hypothetical protein [Verrucomicrobiota bacterium]
TERHIKPKFRAGDYEGGLATGIDLMEKAIRGEYKGTGKTVADDKGGSIETKVIPFLPFLIFLIIIVMIARRSTRRGWGYTAMGGPFIGGWGGGSGGGWSSGGGGGGFSGFSGGGGSFGGGGAGSSW